MNDKNNDSKSESIKTLLKQCLHGQAPCANFIPLYYSGKTHYSLL